MPNIESDMNESHNGEPLFLLKLSDTSLTGGTTLCSLTELDGRTVPSLKKNCSGSVESRRFIAASRSGKIWVVEWSLRNLNFCNEVNCIDLPKMMRYKNDKSNIPVDGKFNCSVHGGNYKLDGVATALTAPSASSCGIRMESVFSVLSMCAIKKNNTTSTSNTAAVFILTTNGMLITLDSEVRLIIWRATFQ